MRVVVAALVAAMMAAPSPASAQDGGAVRVVPGFEKVYRDLRKQEADALKDAARADADLKAADMLALAGERAVAESLAAMEAQQVAYRTTASRLGAATGPAEVQAEARALSDIAGLWSAAEKRRGKGEAMLRAAAADRQRAAIRRAAADARLLETRTAMERAIDRAPVAEAAPTKTGTAPPPTEVVVDALPDAGDAAPASRPLDDQLLGGSAPLKGD